MWQKMVWLGLALFLLFAWYEDRSIRQSCRSALNKSPSATDSLKVLQQNHGCIAVLK